MERVMGIEPTYAAWKAAVLPLNYTRIRALIVSPELRYFVAHVTFCTFRSLCHIQSKRSLL